MEGSFWGYRGGGGEKLSKGAQKSLGDVFIMEPFKRKECSGFEL